MDTRGTDILNIEILGSSGTVTAYIRGYRDTGIQGIRGTQRCRDTGYRGYRYRG